MDLSDFFTPAPKLRPMFNLGCLYDVPNGTYIEGLHGESILVGGLPYFEAIGGRGNTYKSVTADFKMLRVMDRYGEIVKLMTYDTEQSKTEARMLGLAASHDNLAGIDLVSEGRLFLTESVDQPGDVWFAQLKKYLETRDSDKKAAMLTTPFPDKDGKLILAKPPLLVELDSMSMMPLTVVDAIHEKNKVGDSGANVDSMKGASAKSQMLMQIPNITAAHGVYMIATAHVGDEIKIDQYAPSTQKFGFLKGTLKFKNVPEKLSFLSNNCWFNLKAVVYLNKNTKLPEYSYTQDYAHEEGDTDLQIITIQNLRGKSGPSGLPYDLLVSQKEGVLPSLSEFHFLKERNRYGLQGNDRNYQLVICPEINMSRTTIRTKIRESYKLRRALEVTSELLQIHQGHKVDDELACTPEELYNDLAKKYDWNVLLDTVGYWTYVEYPASRPFLSTMDLLRMRAGLYHPYWMK